MLPLAEKLGARLKARGDTIAIAESSTGGLISAALLSVGGASAYFRGGSVIYTHYARTGFLEIPNPLPTPIARFDRAVRAAAGGDGAEQARFDLGAGRDRRHRADRQSLRRRGGPHLHRARGAGFSRAITLETGSADRVANMRAFSKRAMELLAEALG